MDSKLIGERQREREREREREDRREYERKKKIQRERERDNIMFHGLHVWWPATATRYISKIRTVRRRPRCQEGAGRLEKKQQQHIKHTTSSTTQINRSTKLAAFFPA